MQGTILILDGVSTNRIMLKVQLTSAWYHVVLAEGLAGIKALVRRVRPDLIVAAMTLQDGTALDLHAKLASEVSMAAIPIIAITPQNDRAARLAALATGIDEVLAHPLDDMLLQARIRSLIRTRSVDDDLRLQGGTDRVAGLAEAAAGFTARIRREAPTVPAKVAIVASKVATSTLWRARMKGVATHELASHQIDNVHALLEQPQPDVIVLELSSAGDGAGLRLLADLRARGATRHAAIIAVPNPGDVHLATEALDRGAHDVLQGGFCPDELALRITTQLQRKARMDQLRSNVRDGLRAALRDPMTGLYNRRYAMPWLSKIACSSSDAGQSFAVMLADLDHFKTVNDRYGHSAGDAVLVETARRLSAALHPDDMIARIGGEEFLIVLGDAGQNAAMTAADRLCREINATPFAIPGVGHSIKVTISIGVAVSPPPASLMDPGSGEFGDHVTNMLIGQADRALYRAKGDGRNRFTLTRPAA